MKTKEKHFTPIASDESAKKECYINSQNNRRGKEKMNGKKKWANLIVTTVLAAAIALPLAMLLTISPASAIYHPDTNVIDSFLDDTYNRINFNTGQWTDLSPVFANGTEIWVGTNNKYGGTGYMCVWASFDNPQEISKDGVLNTAYCESGPKGASECPYYKQYGDEAVLTVEEVDLSDLTGRLNEDGVPSALQSGLVGPYVYRLYVSAFDHGYGADMVFHFTTTANYAIGKGWVDDISDLNRVRVANVLLEESPDVSPSPTPSPTPTVTPATIPTAKPTPTPTFSPPPTPTPIVPTPTHVLTQAPIGKPQITISQTSLLEEPGIGDEAMITVSLKNIGDSIARNVQLTERIPSSVSVSYVDGADNAGGLVSWSGDLSPGQSRSIQHTFRILEARDRFFIAKVTYEDAEGNKRETSTNVYITTEVADEASSDSDGDGWSDEREKSAGTNPYSRDTDNDGLWDPQDPNPLMVQETETPGFEVVFAVTGLLVVAYLVRKRGGRIK